MSLFKQTRTFHPQMPASLTSSEDSKVSEIFEQAKTDMETIFHEGTQLEREGKLDIAAKKRIEDQLQAISERLDCQLANHIANLRINRTTHRQPIWQRVATIVLILAFISAPLELTIGNGFVFSYSNAYKSVQPTLFALTLPIFAILLFDLEKQRHALSYRYSNWMVRWLIMFPLIVMLSSAILVFSPFGWSALGGWAIGTDSPPRQARVLSVSPERRRIGKCDQTAMLDFDGVQTNICIEDRVVGPALKAGNIVSVRGRSSFLGLFIEEIHVTR